MPAAGDDGVSGGGGDGGVVLDRGGTDAQGVDVAAAVVVVGAGSSGFGVGLADGGAWAVRLLMAGIRREKGSASQGRKSIVVDDLEAMLVSCRRAWPEYGTGRCC